MSTGYLDSRAELLKLARLLDKPAHQLSFLEQVDPDELRALREQVTTVLFDAHLGVLQRMANASKLLPPPVLAQIAERVFGPLLCARMAGVVEVSRGVDVAKRLSPTFLADVATELDPRRAGEIITRIPTDLVRSVAHELAAREDWIAIGRFVGSLPDEAMRDGLSEIDDAALLQVAFLLDDKDDVDGVVTLLSRQRIDGIVRRAAETEQWLTAFDLFTHLGEANSARLTAAFGELDPQLRARAGQLAREFGVYDQLGSLARALS